MHPEWKASEVLQIDRKSENDEYIITSPTKLYLVTQTIL